LGKFLYSTSLNLAFEKPCETDLCVVQHQQRDRIEIGIGECKGDRGHISSEDVENLKATNAKLTAMDLECVLIFAKTADDSYRNEIQLFRQLRDDNIPIVLLTNKETEPYEPYWGEDRERLPVSHPFTLTEMARNSEFPYLR